MYTVCYGVSSDLRHKQHAVSNQCADEDGSSHGAVDQVRPGLQEYRHGDGYSRGDSNQSDSGYYGGRLVDRRVTDVARQSSQICAVEKKTTLQKDVGAK